MASLSGCLDPEQTLYLNCDLPSVEDMVRDPQVFFRGCSRPFVVFDEIHQLRDPARVLKIGADGFPKLKILATGSSTLAASKKFRDTLTGRKRLVHLTPVLCPRLGSASAFRSRFALGASRARTSAGPFSGYAPPLLARQGGG